MTHDHFGTPQQANPVQAEQTREIGLKAVAAAILYRGGAHNIEHTLCRELSAPSAAPASGREP